MVASRIKLISGLLNPVEKTLGALIKSLNSVPLCKVQSLGINTPGRRDCEARLLGQLIRDLHSKRLWPLPAVTDVRHSVSSLAKIIADMAVVPKEPPRTGENQWHWRCRALSLPSGLRQGDLNHSLDYTFAISAEQVQHMKRQAKLTETEGAVPGSARLCSRALWPC